MKTKIEFYQIPSYLQNYAINMANENENGIHDYDAENISDDFVFEYDADNDELISAVYRRFNDGGIAF